MAIHHFTTPITVDRMAPGQAQAAFRTDVERKQTPIKIYDPDSPDMAFASQIAQEIIDISGAEVIVYARTNNSDVDEAWEEDANPTYGAGKHLKAYFAPQPMQSELTPWGLDTPNQMTVVFSRAEIYTMFGDRMVREDDLIDVPYNAASKQKHLDRFRILNAFDSGNFRYNWLYYSCLVENITNDEIQDINHK